MFGPLHCALRLLGDGLRVGECGRPGGHERDPRGAFGADLQAHTAAEEDPDAQRAAQAGHDDGDLCKDVGLVLPAALLSHDALEYAHGGCFGASICKHTQAYANIQG